MGKKRKPGWFGESLRHRLARLGISTKHWWPKTSVDSRGSDSKPADLQFEDALFRGQVDLRLLEGEERGLRLLKLINGLSNSSAVSLDQMHATLEAAGSAARIFHFGLTTPADDHGLCYLSKRLIKAGKCLVVPVLTESLRSWILAGSGPEAYLILKILVVSAAGL